MNNELKPCPFCGSTNVYIDSTFEVDTIYRFVSCHDCASHGSTWWHTEEQAIAAWNTRAERTCHSVKADDGYYECSECHWVLGKGASGYCPSCGAKVVD